MLRIVHTADWHLGQTLNGWSRDSEHRIWIDRVADVIDDEEADVLLVAGDVYDNINPSGDSQEIFYSALRRFRERRPNLRVVVSSGNHDPSARLEAPSEFMQSFGVWTIASVRRDADGEIDAGRHMIALHDAAGRQRAWACVIPFLRAADLPGLSFARQNEAGSPVVAAARRFYADMAARAEAVSGGLPIIAVGHAHCRGATESEGAERRILVGGEHALPGDVFPEAFDHVALGHLHRAQSLDNGRIRYSGSCFPLSAAEAGYDHGVSVMEIDGDRIDVRHRSISHPAPIVRLPVTGRGIDDLERDLAGVEGGDAPGMDPIVYTTIETGEAASTALSRADDILSRYPVRSAGIRIRRPVSAVAPEVAGTETASLAETDPEALFRSEFERVNGVAPDARHLAAYRDAADEV